MKIFALPVAIALLSFSPPAVEKKSILYPNGNKHFEYETKGNLLNGRFTAWFENGRMKMHGLLKNNQKTGIWTAWDSNGVKRSERKFSDDYSFEIINEWDASGKPLDADLLRIKNERLIWARSKEVREKQMRYIHRFWKEIAASDETNKFLFGSNGLFKFMITRAISKKLNVYKEDRGIYVVEDMELLKSFQDATVTSFYLKEEFIFTRDHEVMHTKPMFICPVVEINGEKKEVGWFYIPDVRSRRDAGDDIEAIITNLEKHHYASTIMRTTIDRGGKETRNVLPAESDYYLLAPIEWQSQAWIYFSEK